MGYVGYKPASVPLTSADITDSIITSAKIADGTIVNADINASAGIDASKLSGVGITVADNWRMNSDLTADTNPITNWERVDTSGQGTIGTALTLSSGNFTFPSTGIYLVTMTVCLEEGTNTDNLIQFDMYYNTTRLMQVFQETALASGFTTGTNQTLVNVTSTSHQMYFRVANVTNAARIIGDSTTNTTNFIVIRLGS